MQNKIRWWPLGLIITLNICATTLIWQFPEDVRQFRIFKTIAVETLTLLLLFVWILFISRIKKKTRWQIAGILCLALLICATFFKVKEVSGDFMPILQFRWTSTAVADRSAPLSNARSTDDRNVNFIDSTISYPQFLGARRDATVPDTKLMSNWREHPPRLLWKRPVGEAWSSFAVLGNYAVTQEQFGSDEAVTAYELTTGKIIWRHQYPARFESVIGGVGPRATPTIDHATVYSVGALGELKCLDLKSGNEIWRENILEGTGAVAPEWGIAGSPLVLDSLLIVSVGDTTGNSLKAYNKRTGQRIWGGGTDKISYSSPLFAKIGTVEQVLIFAKGAVVGHSPKNGSVLWKFPWRKETEFTTQPIVLPEGKIFISTGYGAGCALFQILQADGQFSAREIWRSNRLDAKFSSLACHDGYVYGMDDGILACIDLADGKRKWKRGRYGHGQLMLVGDLLLISSENGEIALVETNPEKFTELGRMPVLEGKTWNNPALAGSYLLVRNATEAACLQLTLQ